MEIISDILLGLGALAATIYCMILSKRLRRFNNLENGMGGAVAVLSAQVDDMTKTLEKAQKSAGQSAAILSDLTDRAEESSKKLELMMASLHDLPESGQVEQEIHQETTTYEPRPETPVQRIEEEIVTPHQAPTETEDHSSAPQERAPIFSSKRMSEAAE